MGYLCICFDHSRTIFSKIPTIGYNRSELRRTFYSNKKDLTVFYCWLKTGHWNGAWYCYRLCSWIAYSSIIICNDQGNCVCSCHSIDVRWRFWGTVSWAISPIPIVAGNISINILTDRCNWNRVPERRCLVDSSNWNCID